MLTLLALLLLAGGEEDDLLQSSAAGLPTAAELKQLVERTLPQVGKAMHLRAPRHVETQVLTRDQARRKLAQVLEREYPGDKLDRLGALLKAVHLVEPGADLTAATRALYAKSASGFYDPHDHTLYLLADQPLEAQMLIVPHELAHAVQDENANLEAETTRRMPSEDAQLAFAAAIEGQAQATASMVMAASMAGDSSMADDMSQLTAMSSQMAAAQEEATPWLALQLSFPYTAGDGLIRAVRTREDPLATRVLTKPPASTAQVLSPDLYRAGQAPRELPSLQLAAAVGGQPLYETTLGRANLDLLGEVHANGEKLGAGWRGDRAEAARTRTGTCAAWAVSFESAAPAQAFARAYAHLISAARAGDRVRESDGTFSEVLQVASGVLVLEHVPDAAIDKVEAAGRAALR